MEKSDLLMEAKKNASSLEAARGYLSFDSPLWKHLEDKSIQTPELLCEILTTLTTQNEVLSSIIIHQIILHHMKEIENLVPGTQELYKIRYASWIEEKTNEVNGDSLLNELGDLWSFLKNDRQLAKAIAQELTERELLNPNNELSTLHDYNFHP